MPDWPRGRKRFLVGLFLDAAHVMVAELVLRLDAAGFTGIRPAHSRLFESLDADGTRLATLATRAQMTHQSMGELIDAMERAGYVERVPDPADGRARLVRLTPQGQAMMRTALAELTDIQRAWLRRIAEAPAPDLAGALEWVLRVKDESLDQHAAPIRRPGLAPTPPPAGA